MRAVTAWSLLTLAPVLVSFVLLLITAPTHAIADETSDFALVVDAGSSGSRVSIYQWERRRAPGSIPPFTAPVTRPEWIYTEHPGISSYVDAPEEVVHSIAPLVKFCEHKLHAHRSRFHSIPIFLKATAGMRVITHLPTRDRIMNTIRDYLMDPANSPFQFQRSFARVVSGEEEGVYGWLTANYLSNTLLDTAIPYAFGSLDLGGASTQITFRAPHDILANYFPIRLRQEKIRLYSHSFLYMGRKEAKNRVNDVIARITPPESKHTAAAHIPLLSLDERLREGDDLSTDENVELCRDAAGREVLYRPHKGDKVHVCPSEGAYHARRHHTLLSYRQRPVDHGDFLDAPPPSYYHAVRSTHQHHATGTTDGQTQDEHTLIRAYETLDGGGAVAGDDTETPLSVPLHHTGDGHPRQGAGAKVDRRCTEDGRCMDLRVSDVDPSQFLENPCYPRGYFYQYLHTATQRVYSFRGSSDYKQCAELQRGLLRKKAECWTNTCSFAGVYQPRFENTQFLAFSGFQRVVVRQLQLPWDVSLQTLQRTAEEVCQLSWPQLKRRFPQAALLELPHFCFDASYVYTLLKVGYGMHSLGTRVLFVNQIDNIPLGWTLGSVIYEVNALPWQIDRSLAMPAVLTPEQRAWMAELLLNGRVNPEDASSSDPSRLWNPLAGRFERTRANNGGRPAPFFAGGSGGGEDSAGNTGGAVGAVTWPSSSDLTAAGDASGLSFDDLVALGTVSGEPGRAVAALEEEEGPVATAADGSDVRGSGRVLRPFAVGLCCGALLVGGMLLLYQGGPSDSDSEPSGVPLQNQPTHTPAQLSSTPARRRRGDRDREWNAARLTDYQSLRTTRR